MWQSLEQCWQGDVLISPGTGAHLTEHSEGGVEVCVGGTSGLAARAQARQVKQLRWGSVEGTTQEVVTQIGTQMPAGGSLRLKAQPEAEAPGRITPNWILISYYHSLPPSPPLSPLLTCTHTKLSPIHPSVGAKSPGVFLDHFAPSLSFQ